MLKTIGRYRTIETYKVIETKEWEVALREKVFPEGEKAEPYFVEKTNMRKIVYDITYKKPAKLRISSSEEDEITIINNAVQWEYNQENATACQSSSKIPQYQTNYLLVLAEMLVKMFRELSIRYLVSPHDPGYHQRPD